ncbi:hypothetical protein MA958_003754 [Escherichia coli]|nr:hypothetical protein [Escherichia coli]
MYCTVKEIIRDVLDTDVPDSECVFAVVLTRGDVRHISLIFLKSTPPGRTAA